jgi:hypothetical protein
MPGYDYTGPTGAGPLTGMGLGYCGAGGIGRAREIQAEAASLQDARRQWIENGRGLQRIMENYKVTGQPIPARISRLLQQWESQGRYLKAVGEEVQETGLGIIPLLVIGGIAATTVIGGIFTAKKAIEVQEQHAERQAEIVKMVTEGQITPAEASALQTGAAGGGDSVFKKLFGISPLLLIGGALAVVFGKDLFKKVFK